MRSIFVHILESCCSEFFGPLRSIIKRLIETIFNKLALSSSGFSRALKINECLVPRIGNEDSQLLSSSVIFKCSFPQTFIHHNSSLKSVTYIHELENLQEMHIYGKLKVLQQIFIAFKASIMRIRTNVLNSSFLISLPIGLLIPLFLY